MLLIVSIGLIHLGLMQDEFEEAQYVGILFAANFIGALTAALGIRRGSRWGWGLGLVVVVGSLLGYLLSRSVGLPGMDIESWLDPFGILSLLAEIAFLALFVQKAPWKETG